MKIRFLLIIVFVSTLAISCQALQLPEILTGKNGTKNIYLPDFSYAGYKNGEAIISYENELIVDATTYGVIANDALDDSKSLKKAIDAANAIQGNVVILLPKGRLILSDIIYLERSNIVLRGQGSGALGTELFFPRPLMYSPEPEGLKELREYLIQFDKRERQKADNVDLAFSQYAWSGGFIWTQVPGERVKSYLENYEVPVNTVANVYSGKQGGLVIEVDNTSKLAVGDVLELQLFNKDGETGAIINALYFNNKVKVGSHHWAFPELPIVRQQVEIKAIKGNKVTLNTPLTIEIVKNFAARLVEWKHLKEVGIEHLAIVFPDSPTVAHHVEQGFNGIFLTRLYNSWVDDVVITNGDSGILTEEIANVTIKNIKTDGNHFAHYTVAMGGVHNVLVDNLKVMNNSEHPLSFNTFSTKNVYKNCEVFNMPVLDQHSGANHQNLFDNIKVHIDNTGLSSYPLFAGGGAGYWKPSHGAYSTLYNVKAIFKNVTDQVFTLDGMNDGVRARLIGIHGNMSLKINYEPESYIIKTNEPMTSTPSLYDYQLNRRLKK